ncbi:MAG: SCO family protein [Pseudomonadota bacterium]
MISSKLLLSTGAVLAAATAGLATLYATQPGDAFAPCRADNMVDHAAIGGPFTLIDETGAGVTDADVFDQPTLFYLGYTFCPDVCPMDNLRNADAVDLLEDRGLQSRAVFVSVDPKRDTPDVLAEFTDFFHPQMLGLTGTPAQVESLAEDYASVFEIREADDDEFYLIDHSTFTFLVLPGHGVVDVIRRDEPAEVVAERAACLIAKA